MRGLGAVLILAAVAGCGGSKPAEPEPVGEPGRGAAYPIKEPAPDIAAAAIGFAGSCAFAKPPGELEDYQVRVIATRPATVYATSRFGDGAANRIGFLSAGGTLRAQGPIAAGASAERGFAVLVIDGSGRVCRGYVAAAALSPAR